MNHKSAIYFRVHSIPAHLSEWCLTIAPSFDMVSSIKNLEVNFSLKKPKKPKIGLRTIKTAAAVVISMMIVTFYGATTSKLVFAMLGAMAALQPTFKESLDSCLTQIVGLFFGAFIAVLLMMTPIHPLVATGIGIILVITLYNMFQIRFSPSLPCLIVVTMCTTPDIQPLTYAIGRFWDSAIGLGVGMLINTLFFPYDNSKIILDTAHRLETELIRFLEDMFDGDDHLPSTEKTVKSIDDMARQLVIFSRQISILHPRRHRHDYEKYQIYIKNARQIVAHMEVLCRIDKLGILNAENHKRLHQCGAVIKDQRLIHVPEEEDIVTNYHVSQLLTLRQELLNSMKK